MSVSAPIESGVYLKRQIDSHDRELTIYSLIGDVKTAKAQLEKDLAALAAIDPQLVRENFPEEYQWYLTEND